MLNELFPRAHQRYSSLPILGSIAGDFTSWLKAQGYRRGTTRVYLRFLSYLDHVLQQRQWVDLCQLTRQDLRSCRPANSQDNRNLAAVVHALECYLDRSSLRYYPTTICCERGEYAFRLLDVGM